MDRFEKIKEEIDGIDHALAELFCRRMEKVRAMAAYKQEHGLPIPDPEGEEQSSLRHAAEISDPDLLPYYMEFLRDTQKSARHYQGYLLRGMRVAFSGIAGAFASIAAGRIFPDAERVPYNDFASAYRAVENGDCDACVLPLENSTAGEVGQVTDLLFSGSLYVTGIYELAVHHHLLAGAGASLASVKRVISHPQALSQCEGYLRRHGYEQLQAGNTAMAARQVAESGDPTLAAIASEETAALYGLQILERSINEEDINTTRFAVLSRAPIVPTGSGVHSILMFTVKHEAGSLAEAIHMIGRYGYNMRCLRSRPMRSLLWQYYFYVELEGSLDNERGKEMLEALSAVCQRVKIAGAFRYPSEI